MIASRQPHGSCRSQCRVYLSSAAGGPGSLQWRPDVADPSGKSRDRHPTCITFRPRSVTCGRSTHSHRGAAMRFIQAVLFLIFLGAVGLFAVQNMDVISVTFWTWKLTAPVALVIVAVYFLGMLSGWTVVAFIRRSIRRVAESPRD